MRISHTISDSQRYAFIVGPHRSGTTLLRSLLDQHADVGITPELRFFDLVMGDWFSVTAKERARKQLRARFHLENVDDWRTWKELYQIVIHRLANKKLRDLLIEKTPLNIFFIRRLQRWFPDADFIFMLRDGREVCASAVKKWGNKGTSSISIAARWAYAMDVHESALRPTQHMLIRYENLTSSPEAHAEQLFRSLGIAFDASYVDSLTSTSSFDDTASKKGIHVSAHFRQFFAPTEQRVIEGLLRSRLRAYGYPLYFDSSRVPIRDRLRFWLAYITHRLYFTLCRLGIRRIYVGIKTNFTYL